MSKARKVKAFDDLAQAWWAYDKAVEEMTDTQLAQHRVQVAQLSETNCWYAEYYCKKSALVVLDRERSRRKYLADHPGVAP